MNRSVVLLDGGMGQELVKRSGQEPTPLWSARVMLDNPNLVQTIHEEYIEAGAKVITLNNYTATPERLSRDATVDLIKPIHQSAKHVASRARTRVGIKDLWIAGSLPPLVASYKPELTPSEEQCLGSYRELVALQKDGVDIFIVETASTIREAVAATRAVEEIGMLVWTSFTLSDEGDAKLRSGENLEDAMEQVISAGADAILINCSMPETIDRATHVLRHSCVPTGAYANGFTSIAGLDAGGTVKSLSAREDLSPEIYAKWGRKCVDAGLTIIGGCCETSPAHIAALRFELESAGYKISKKPQ